MLLASKQYMKITPITKPTLTLEQLLAQVNEHNLHGEVDTGPAVGNEVW